MLRSIPNLNVFRPCDIRETYAAWKESLLSLNTPSAIILSRQNLPLMEGSSTEGVSKGAYVVSKEQEKAMYTVIATGSEVSLAVSLQKQLMENYKIDIRVVSMPCWERFEEQDKEYQNEVLVNDYSHTISLEMLSTFGWGKWAKHNIGVDTFGASAPMKDVFNKFGFTVDKIVNKFLEIKSLND